MPVQLLGFLHMVGVTIRPLAEKKNLLLVCVYMQKFNPLYIDEIMHVIAYKEVLSWMCL